MSAKPAQRATVQYTPPAPRRPWRYERMDCATRYQIWQFLCHTNMGVEIGSVESPSPTEMRRPCQQGKDTGTIAGNLRDGIVQICLRRCQEPYNDSWGDARSGMWMRRVVIQQCTHIAPYQISAPHILLKLLWGPHRVRSLTIIQGYQSNHSAYSDGRRRAQLSPHNQRETLQHRKHRLTHPTTCTV